MDPDVPLVFRRLPLAASLRVQYVVAASLWVQYVVAASLRVQYVKASDLECTDYDINL